jgi:beta-glucosidase
LSAVAIGPDETLEVAINVGNTGSGLGEEVVQLYVRDLEAAQPRPEKELRAFTKMALAPGERATVTLALAREAFAYFDDRTGEWVAEAGAFELLVGASPRDIRARATVELNATRRRPA